MSSRPKKIIWRIFRGLAWTLFALLILVVVGAFAILKWPQIIINERVFEQVANLSARFGWVVQWDEAQISVESENLLHKSFDFDFKNFCAFDEAGSYRACFEQLRLAAELAWLRGGLEILEVGPVILKAGEVKVTLPETKDEPEKEPDLFFLPIPELLIPERLSHTRWKKIALDFSEIKIISGDDPPIILKASLGGEPDPDDKIHQFTGKIGTEGLGPIQAAQAELSLTSESGFSENDWQFKVQPQVRLENGATLSGPVQLSLEEPKRYAIGGDLKFQQGNQNISVDLAGSLEPGKISARLQGRVLGLTDALKELNLQSCKLNWQQVPSNHRRADLDYNCRLKVVPGKIKIADEALENNIELPSVLQLQADGRVNLGLIPSANDPLSGNLNLKMSSITKKLLTFEGEVQAQFAGVPVEYPRNWKLITEADISILLKSFQKLERILARTPYAVPAPFNVFDGELELSVKGEVDIAGFAGDLPLSFATRLSSKEQNFYTEGKGELKYKYGKKEGKSHFQMDLALSDVKLILPTVQIEAPPRLFPDGRYNQEIEPVLPDEEPSEFTYEVKVYTEENKPVLVNSNLARGPIPVFIDVMVVPEKTSGTLSIGDAKIEMFRRVAEIRKMVFELAKPTNKSTIDGVIGVSYSDYDVQISVVGPFMRPKTYFTSSPPLDREEIISLLIFGRTFDDLNEEESKSVGAVSGAAADRALALGTLYFLGSTPIESLGYNPNTGEFSAKLRLAKGSSLTLGSRDFETQRVGFRQTLGGNWSLSTFVENDSETGEQSGGGMIEWFKRY